MERLTWLLLRFRSGTHGLNEELGRHSTIVTIVKLYVFCSQIVGVSASL